MRRERSERVMQWTAARSALGRRCAPLARFIQLVLACLLIPAAGAVMADVDDGLVGHWRFDEASGISAADSSATGNDGTLQNADGDEWVPGQVGSGAIAFDGVNDFLQTPQGAPFIPAGDYSAAVWINAAASQKNWSGIYSFTNASGSQNYCTLQFDNSAGRDVQIRHGSSTWEPGLRLADVAGSWHHLAIVRSGTAMTFYLDGSPYATTTMGTPPTSATGHLNIGAERTASTSYVFSGTIDDLRFYDRPLTPLEVAELATQRDPDLVLHLKLDDGSGTNAADSSGYYNDGTLYDMDPGTDWVSGVLGSALDFDGSNDYLEVPHSPELNGSSALTYTAWVHPHSWSGTRQVMAKSVHGGGSGRAQMGIFSESGLLTGRAETTAGRINVRVTLPPLNAWSHVALVFDGTSLKLYVNGQLVGSQGFAATTLVQNNDPLAVSKRVGTAQYFFDGLIDDVRVYTRALSGAEIAGLYGVNTVSYFLISHDGAGVHCLAEPITVAARDSAGATIADYAGQITLDTQTGKGTWWLATGSGTLIDAVANDGRATYQFSTSDGGLAIFSLGYEEGVPDLDIEVYESANSAIRDDDSEGLIHFAPSGFTLTANALPNPPPDPISDPIPAQTAGSGFALHLTAFGTTPTDTECGVIESYAGSRTLKFWSMYSDPASGTLRVTIDGSSIAPSEASASEQSVSFSNGQAAVAAKYKDVGEIRIQLKDDAVTEPVGGIVGATNLFVVKPADFLITSVTRPDLSGNPGTSTPPDEVFVAAGSPFHVTLEVRDAEGARTPNYGNESSAEGVRIVAASLVAPAGGRNGTADDGSIGNGSSFAATMPAGTFTGTSFYWDEVGAVQLRASVADGSYLGAGDVTGNVSGVVGRFTPFDFAIAYNAPLFRTSCSAGGFSYLGQGFDYLIGSEPLITATALNAQGGTTQNYTGSWFRLQDASLAGLAYASGSGTLSVGAPNLPSVVEAAAGVGTITFDNGPSLSFVRSSPVAPFDAEIQLSVDVIDADGIAYSGNPAVFGAPTPGSGVAWSTGKSTRFGRASLQNAHGPEVEALAVPLIAEYYDGVAFVPHTADACTSLGVTDLSLTANPGGLSSTPTIANAPLVSGEAGLSLSAPGPGNTGYFDLAFDLSPTGADLPFLRSDADADGVYDDNPSSRATFGIFPGNDAIIYLRELY